MCQKWVISKPDDLTLLGKARYSRDPCSCLDHHVTTGEDVDLLDVREADQRSDGEIYPDESYAIP